MTTIYHLARLAGVSPSTVSRALNGHPRISEATRRRIQALAAEFGYLTRTASHGLLTEGSDLLGCVMHQNLGPGALEILQGMMDQAFHEGLVLSVLQTGESPAYTYQAVRTLLDLHVRGILLAHSTIRTLPDELGVVKALSSVNGVECTYISFSLTLQLKPREKDEAK